MPVLVVSRTRPAKPRIRRSQPLITCCCITAVVLLLPVVIQRNQAETIQVVQAATTSTATGSESYIPSILSCDVRQDNGNIECSRPNRDGSGLALQGRLEGGYSGVALVGGAAVGADDSAPMACGIASNTGRIDCWAPFMSTTKAEPRARQLGHLSPLQQSQPYTQVAAGGDRIACAIREGAIDCFRPSATAKGTRANSLEIMGSLPGNYSNVFLGERMDDDASVDRYPMCTTISNPARIVCLDSGEATLSFVGQYPMGFKEEVSVAIQGASPVYGCATRANQTAIDCFGPITTEQNAVETYDVMGSFPGSYEQVVMARRATSSVVVCGLHKNGIDCFHNCHTLALGPGANISYEVTGFLLGSYHQVTMGGISRTACADCFVACAVQDTGDAIDCFNPTLVGVKGGTYKLETTHLLQPSTLLTENLPSSVMQASEWSAQTASPSKKGAPLASPLTATPQPISFSSPQPLVDSEERQLQEQNAKVTTRERSHIKQGKERGQRSTGHSNIFMQQSDPETQPQSEYNDQPNLRGDTSGKAGDELASISVQQTSPERKGMLDDIIDAALEVGKYAAAGAAGAAAGAAVGAGSLAGILCATGTLCGDKTETRFVMTSSIITITLPGVPDDSDLTGENGLISQIEAFYTVSIAEAFGGTATTSNPVNAFGGKVDVEVDSTPAAFESYEIVEFSTSIQTISGAAAATFDRGSTPCKQSIATTARNGISGARQGFFDPQVVDIAIQTADEEVLLVDYIQRAGGEDSVYRNAMAVETVSTTTVAPSATPSQVPSTQPSVSEQPSMSPSDDATFAPTAPPSQVQPSVSENPSLSSMPSQSAGPTVEQVVLYENDFESPNVPVDGAIGCPIIDTTDVNTHYGTTENMFAQSNTVETILVTTSSWNSTTPYSDPAGVGGQYCLGMLSTVNDDKVALSFDPQGRRFVNVMMDISSLDINCGSGPYGIAHPIFQVSALDSPTGEPIITGDVLDSGTVTGAVAANGWTFLWTSTSISLDVSEATSGGRVSIVWDLIQSGYGVFDNLSVTSSDTALVTPSPSAGPTMVAASDSPSLVPSKQPSSMPSQTPSNAPSKDPSQQPSSSVPSQTPSNAPSNFRSNSTTQGPSLSNSTTTILPAQLSSKMALTTTATKAIKVFARMVLMYPTFGGYAADFTPSEYEELRTLLDDYYTTELQANGVFPDFVSCMIMFKSLSFSARTKWVTVEFDAVYEFQQGTSTTALDLANYMFFLGGSTFLSQYLKQSHPQNHLTSIVRVSIATITYSPEAYAGSVLQASPELQASPDMQFSPEMQVSPEVQVAFMGREAASGVSSPTESTPSFNMVTQLPSPKPSPQPTSQPTDIPTKQPTLLIEPSHQPTPQPTLTPSSAPSSTTNPTESTANPTTTAHWPLPATTQDPIPQHKTTHYPSPPPLSISSFGATPQGPLLTDNRPEPGRNEQIVLNNGKKRKQSFSFTELQGFSHSFSAVGTPMSSVALPPVALSREGVQKATKNDSNLGKDAAQPREQNKQTRMNKRGLKTNKHLRRNTRGLKASEYSNILRRDSDSPHNAKPIRPKLRGQAQSAQTLDIQKPTLTGRTTRAQMHFDDPQSGEMEETTDQISLRRKKGFLDDLFDGLIEVGKLTAVGAAGAAAGAGGLAAILCATGTICGDNTEERFVMTSGIVTITLSGIPDDSDIDGENGLINQIEAFYTVSIAEAFGGTATTSNPVNAFGGKVDVEVDSTPAAFEDFTITEFQTSIQTIAGPVSEAIDRGSTPCRQSVSYTGRSTISGQSMGFFDPQVVDIAIQTADEQVLLVDYIQQAGAEDSVYRDAMAVETVSTTTVAPSATPSQVPSTQPSASGPTLNPSVAPPQSAAPTIEQVVLYENDFESPMVPVTVASACSSSGIISFTDVNTHYGTPENQFGQRFTIETVLITTSSWDSMTSYSDPAGIGGQYCLGMLGTFEEDRLALSFDPQGRRFINVMMDISSLDLPCASGPFGIADPIFSISAIDSPLGDPIITGTILDSGTVTGPVAANQWTFEWTSNVISLDVSLATVGGKVSIVWDLIQSGYAVLDNLVVTASDTALASPAPSSSAPTPAATAAAVSHHAQGIATLSTGSNLFAQSTPMSPELSLSFEEALQKANRNKRRGRKNDGQVDNPGRARGREKQTAKNTRGQQKAMRG